LIVFPPLRVNKKAVAREIQYIEHIETSIVFDVSGTQEVHLMDVVGLKRFSEIEIFRSSGGIRRFFLSNPSLFGIRLMVRSEGRIRPYFLNYHLGNLCIGTCRLFSKV
jgi:hypothetical protein